MSRSPSPQRVDRGIDAERLQDSQNFRDDGMIRAQAAERNVPPGAVLHESAPALITASPAARAHIHFATAMSTAQKPRQQQLSTPHRSSDRRAFAGRMSPGSRVQSARMSNHLSSDRSPSHSGNSLYTLRSRSSGRSPSGCIRRRRGRYASGEIVSKPSFVPQKLFTALFPSDSLSLGPAI
jgi:hypothetical protein